MLRKVVLTTVIVFSVTMWAVAQGRGGPQVPAVVSPEVHADRRVTFRIAAPDAQRVELRTPGDIPGRAPGGDLGPFAMTETPRVCGRLRSVRCPPAPIGMRFP